MLVLGPSQQIRPMLAKPMCLQKPISSPRILKKLDDL